MKFAPLGESAVLVDTELLPDLAAPVVRRWTGVLEASTMEGVVEIVPSFTTVAVFYDAAQLAREQFAPPYTTVCQWIESRLTRFTSSHGVEARQFVVPVCYGAEFGPDIEEVARVTKLTTETVIRLHSRAVYEVRAVGFSPGFPYLGGMDAALATPRLDVPRVLVPAGSVAIGGAQTGVYPVATPGGWRLIGRTPLRLFDSVRAEPALLRMGDEIRFVPIDVAAYARQAEHP